MADEIDAAVGFSVFPGIGPARYRLLTGYFGTAAAAWQASEDDLTRIGLPERLVRPFVRFRESFSVSSYRQRLTDLDVTVLPESDSRYPAPLRSIADPPIVLYVRGRRKGNLIDFSRAIAVVGTRKPTMYGETVTRSFVSGFVAAGCPIISGMALGIDAVAHETAIAGDGHTIAVLGGGVDVISPMSNAGIYEKLTRCGYGAVVSEMPLGFVPERWSFPLRNRIISGLSRAVVVTEGADDSGTLITARLAAEQGREVFAVPGPVDSPMSAAPNALIKTGAGVATDPGDILTALGISVPAASPGAGAASGRTTAAQLSILRLLTGRGPMHVDDLARELGLPVSCILADCTILEVSGAIRGTANSVYRAGDQSV